MSLVIEIAQWFLMFTLLWCWNSARLRAEAWKKRWYAADKLIERLNRELTEPRCRVVNQEQYRCYLFPGHRGSCLFHITN